MSNLRLSKHRQVVSMQDTFTTAKTILDRTKLSTGPHADRGLRVGHTVAVIDESQKIPKS